MSKNVGLKYFGYFDGDFDILTTLVILSGILAIVRVYAYYS